MFARACVSACTVAQAGTRVYERTGIYVYVYISSHPKKIFLSRLLGTVVCFLLDPCRALWPTGFRAGSITINSIPLRIFKNTP